MEFLVDGRKLTTCTRINKEEGAHGTFWDLDLKCLSILCRIVWVVCSLGVPQKFLAAVKWERVRDLFALEVIDKYYISAFIRASSRMRIFGHLHLHHMLLYDTAHLENDLQQMQYPGIWMFLTYEFGFHFYISDAEDSSSGWLDLSTVALSCLNYQELCFEEYCGPWVSHSHVYRY